MKGLKYIILEHDMALVDKAIMEGENDIYFANAAQKSVLEHFNISGSNAIVVSIRNEKQKRLICENIKAINPNINTVVVVNNEEEESEIHSLGINHIINDREIVSNILVEKALTCALR